MQPPLDFDPQLVLSKPLMIHLSSTRNGSPRSSPLWFIYEENKVWLFGSQIDSFVKRLQDEPECALSLVDFDLDHGVLLHVGIRGSVIFNEVDQMRLQRFLIKYLGKYKHNEWFIQEVVEPLNVMLEVNQQSIIARDVSYFKTGPILASSKR
jgi:general stress protein 26